MYQQQINQIDPAQLDQLLESLVKAKAEANYQQLRQTAQRQVDAIRQQAGNDHQALQGQVYQKLSQLNQEKQILEMRETNS
jgi:regulator of protease activity HflC (stomatin/prohibitin superfamily)